MSERKKGGGLDYTPRAFPGARAPDGPAPGLENQLAELGLVERADAQDARSDASADVNPGTKKRGSLDYTPRAFPGARAPDGPAPHLEDRLVAMGLAERTAMPGVRPDVRRDASYAAPQPPVRQERPSASPPAESPLPTHFPAQLERVTGPAPQARIPALAHASPASFSGSEQDMAPGEPVFKAQPATETTRRREQVLASEPTRRFAKVSPSEPEVPGRTERAASHPTPATPSSVFIATPQPVYVVPAPGSIAAQISDQQEQTLKAALPLSRVPREGIPRPLPLAAEPNQPVPNREMGVPGKADPKAKTRAASSIERLKMLPDKAERVRLSVRLVASVDEKLNELAHLRGLDRNTAVSVAIVQDWIRCFGLQSQQA